VHRSWEEGTDPTERQESRKREEKKDIRK